MRTLTVRQPHASLIACGAKRYETRSWSPSPKQLVPGDLLAIHAGKQEDTKGFDAMGREAESVASSVFEERGIDLGTPLPTGKVLVVCRYMGAYLTEDGRIEVPPGEWYDVGWPERLLGDFSPGRFAWELAVVEVFDPPIPARGRQGLWEWEGEAK